MEPFRAFVGDKLSPAQRTSGFAMQSFFIGTGSVIAALLPWVFKNWFDMSNTADGGTIPDSVKWSFYTGAFAFFIAVMYTVFTTKEFPPESIEKLKEENKKTGFLDGLKESYQGIFSMPKAMKQLAWVQFFTWFALFSMWIYSTNAVTSNIYDMKVTRALYTKLKDNLNAQKLTLSEKDFSSLNNDIKEIDRFQSEDIDVTLTINLANHFVKMENLVADDRTTLKRVQEQYNNGADWLGVCSSVRNGVAAIFAFIIPLIAMKLGRKKTHMVCLIIGGVGLASLNFVIEPWTIAISMGLVGIAWASILSMPYAILSGSLPANKMGYYMGVFNFFIVIPQILAATVLGFLTINVFSGNTMLTLVLGGAFMILAGLLALRVDDKD
jgi:maltose/moltooligosaccharide transporter